jgi:hypothetical protein
MNINLQRVRLLTPEQLRHREEVTCQHAQHGGLGLGGKELEDGQHAPRADVIAVNEAQGVSNGVPHAGDALTGAAVGKEPLGKRHLHTQGSQQQAAAGMLATSE